MPKPPDPRLSHYLGSLPHYMAILWRLTSRAEGDERARPLLTAHVYLGLKLGDSAFWRDRLVRTAGRAGSALDAAGDTNGRRPASTRRLRSLSAQADAFLFTTYGGLDALAQIVVGAHDVQAEEEVKFPAVERMLGAGCRHPDGCHALRALLTETYDARWFRDLRRLRNLVNFRTLLATGAAAAAGEAYRIGEPDQGLGGLHALPGFCATTHDEVARTVEAALHIMERNGTL